MKINEKPDTTRNNLTAFIASVAANPMFMRFRALPVSSHLAVGEAMELFSCFEEESFRRGDEIYRAGSHSTRTVYLILEGSVSLSDEPGNFFATLKAGDVFGLFSFLDERPHSVSVCAQEELTVLSLPRAYFDVITLEDPLLGNRVLHFMFHLLSSMSLTLGSEYAALREYQRGVRG